MMLTRKVMHMPAAAAGRAASSPTTPANPRTLLPLAAPRHQPLQLQRAGGACANHPARRFSQQCSSAAVGTSSSSEASIEEPNPTPPTSPHTSSGSAQDSRAAVLEEARSFLKDELERLFNKGEVTRSRYSPDIVFQDPITSTNSLDGYVFNINMLKTLFQVSFQLHTIDVTGEDEVTARWTMAMVFSLLPWRPTLLFTGRTFYKVDLDSGLIKSHIDVWDALQDNAYLSLEGALHVVRMLTKVQLTPSIETPQFTVLKKFKEYEIRQYPTFLVAETTQPPGSGPASGSGFTDLASYIFGGNQEQVKMEMTTPVLSTVTEQGDRSMNMQFVMESRFKDVDQLPTPKDARVVKKQLGGGFFAAIDFSGWPLDFEVVENERKLRDALLRDGLKPKAGYQLARYNEPTVLPPLRRNEVLIELQDFQWP